MYKSFKNCVRVEESKNIAKVGKKRRDGKFPVSYIFPNSGKVIRKIETMGKILEFCDPEKWDLYGLPKS